MSALEELMSKQSVMEAANGTKVAGYVYVRTYSELPTKNGSMYFAGKLEMVGAVDFKVWAGNTFNKMKETNMANNICHINAEVNEYNGTKSLIINDIQEYTEDELLPEMFFEQKYNPDELWSSLNKILAGNCSPEGIAVFNLVIEPYKERFMKEYAAISHHDACMSGLLAHSRKVVFIAQIIKSYPNIFKSIDRDLLYVSAALHDIGKTQEYTNGSISEAGKKMSHLTLGLEMIRPFHDQIVELKGEDFYESLQSVIQQHHGEYGERPRTLAAYIIHIIDMLESQLTDIDEVICSATSDQVKIEGCILSFYKSEE